MVSPVGFIYTDASKYNFGEGHPLTPLRIELTYSLMKHYNLLDAPNIALLTPRIATDDEILRVHVQKYLDEFA